MCKLINLIGGREVNVTGNEIGAPIKSDIKFYHGERFVPRRKICEEQRCTPAGMIGIVQAHKHFAHLGQVVPAHGQTIQQSSR